MVGCLLSRTAHVYRLEVCAVTGRTSEECADESLSLAWAELYLAFAHVFRKFDIELDPSR